MSRGLGLFWKDNVNIQVLFSSLNVIHTSITINEIAESFDCSFVYGNPIYQQRKMLWPFLIRLQNDLSKAWYCIGDFNEILSQFEKDGLRRQQRGRIENFRSFIN